MAVISVSLNKSSITLTVSESEILVATVNPNNATDKTVNWTSSNTAVATVDASGNVTAVSAGTATITVTTTDGNMSATCAVTVEAASGGGSGSGSESGSGGGVSASTYHIAVAKAENGTVSTDYKSARAGRLVTVTAKADDKYVLKGVTVTTATGKEISVTDKGNGKYTFTMPSAAVTVSAVIGMPFEDVIQGDTFHDDIEWVYTNSYMIGKTATFFDEKGSITRQQICMVMARVNGVWPEHMVDAVEWGIENGIFDGSRPGDAATREEMITMMWKAFGKQEADEAVLEAYPDAGDVSSESRLAMAWAVEVGIVKGTRAGELEPTSNITRGAFAGILHRYLAK